MSLDSGLPLTCSGVVAGYAAVGARTCTAALFLGCAVGFTLDDTAVCRCSLDGALGVGVALVCGRSVSRTIGVGVILVVVLSL
jgi:hypothetical protein